ncbi:MAG: SNF2 helicase associated domain-containing protein [Clostridiales bacterium]|nr:SNF2 helicase associated domain-containing protein [Clostridiales bacterium]
MERLDKNWKDQFNSTALERGQTACINRKVDALKENGNDYSAAVLDRERHEVSLTLKNGRPIRMKCHCPVARSGNHCYHMAALLFAIEELDHPERVVADSQKKKAVRANTEKRTKTESARREKEEAERRAREEAERCAREDAERRAKEDAERCAREEAERLAREEAERAERRAAREKRKAERAQKEAEQKAAAEAERQRQLAKQQAEKERREAIRKEKKAEEERRRAKRAREQAEAKAAAEKRKKQEEKARREEQLRREEEEARMAEVQERRERERLEAERLKKEMKEKHDRMVGEYTLLGEAWQEDAESVVGHASPDVLEQYSYFDGEAIFQSMDFSRDRLRDGEKLYKQGVIDQLEINTGYERYNTYLYRDDDSLVGQAIWYGTDEGTEIQTTLVFERDSVRRTRCTCPACRKSYSWYYDSDSDCKYTAGVLFAVRDYLETHHIGDATDWNAGRLLALYERKRANLLAADSQELQESLMLKPRLIKKDGDLTLSFKIGKDRLFVVKELDEFCENVRNAATAQYGSSTKINHKRSNFTDEGKKWLRFIERIVQEEEEFCQRLEHATRSRNYYHKSAKVGGSLNLFGWRLDELYRELGAAKIEYEDRDMGKKKQILQCGEGNPHITLQISEASLDYVQDYGNQKKRSVRGSSIGDDFHGIEVEGVLPELYFGMEYTYYVKGSIFCRSSHDFQEKIEHFASMADEDGIFSFRVGRNNLAEFYYQLLPDLQDVVDVVETDPDRIHSFVAPPVNFVFYLDAYGGDVQCSPFARYEQKEYTLLDYLHEEGGPREMFRNFTAEQEILYRAMSWLPVIDPEREALSCDGDEELIYRMMTDGVNELLTLGEVQCTPRFRAKRKIRPVKVSVGVSVSGGLLDLDIMTDDVPPEELLDILSSYREKKNYYRLKDGSYIDMDEQSVELLSELMDSMHLKPKDFVNGKMHLPLYRTLYLNKMLEENDGVYSDRDTHFREMVKEFKTVNDADFDVPASLSKIMRKYQKDGYKWLRTLETWQLGGILADDMGLGKTLQIIALLLAAKERGVDAVSLVVAPASLVFNWGEEFARFAPDLRILAVAGTQESRQEKIASYRDYDVLVTSYDLLKRDIHLYEDIEFEYEVIDEAQYIKNHTTAAAKAVKVIRSRYHFALTGTPIENRLSELWSIFDFLMPGFLYTYEVFKRELETPIAKYQDETAMNRLRKMTGPFILRRLKEDVLKDLPDKLEEVRYVRFAEKQQQLYDGQVLHMRELIGMQDASEFNKNKLQVLTELMRLRQICCDPSLCFDRYKGESAKADACMDLIQSAIDGGHRMLLFSQFTSMLEILSARLDREKIPYFTITGSTAKQKRLELVKAFNSGSVPVFLISLKAGGVGLNLTGADVVIHYDPWWNVAAQNQATDRAHRIGQTKKVTVFKLIARGSIEEKILELQEAKRDLADQVISGETGQLAGMTRDDLLELLD